MCGDVSPKEDLAGHSTLQVGKATAQLLALPFAAASHGSSLTEVNNTRSLRYRCNDVDTTRVGNVIRTYRLPHGFVRPQRERTVGRILDVKRTGKRPHAHCCILRLPRPITTRNSWKKSL